MQPSQGRMGSSPSTANAPREGDLLMLVLSRRTDEDLVFPNLNVRIRILRTEGSRVRLGIDAPQWIEVSRGERFTTTPASLTTEGQSSHAFRNLLNAVRLAMALYDRQMDGGDMDGAN